MVVTRKFKISEEDVDVGGFSPQVSTSAVQFGSASVGSAGIARYTTFSTAFTQTPGLVFSELSSNWGIGSPGIAGGTYLTQISTLVAGSFSFLGSPGGYINWMAYGSIV